jgi:hypothetical protein
MTEKAEERGSSRLALSQSSGVEPGNSIIRGIPVPTWLAGTVKATSEQAADPVLSLLKLRSRCDVFPYAVPAIDGVLGDVAGGAECGE